MGYTSQATLNVVKTLIKALFMSNAKLDNIAYSLSTPLGYPILGDIMHHHVAHAYGKQADIITEFLDLRDDFVLRGKEIVEPKQGTSVLECLSEAIKIQEEIEEVLRDCIVTAMDNMDFPVEDTLRDFYKDSVVLYTKQVNKLYNMAKKYEEDGNLCLFDTACKEYIITERIE